MFAYPDAARYRLGTNYPLLPTNAAKSLVYSPFERDGQMNFSRNYDGDPNYVRSSIKPLKYLTKAGHHDKITKGQLASLTEHERWVGEVCSFTSEVEKDDFVQAERLWDVLGKEAGHQGRYVSNVASHVSGITETGLRSAVFGECSFNSSTRLLLVLLLNWFLLPCESISSPTPFLDCVADIRDLAELFEQVHPTLGSRIKDATSEILRKTSCPECGPSLTKVRSHIMHGPPQSKVDGETCDHH